MEINYRDENICSTHSVIPAGFPSPSESPHRDKGRLQLDGTVTVEGRVAHGTQMKLRGVREQSAYLERFLATLYFLRRAPLHYLQQQKRACSERVFKNSARIPLARRDCECGLSSWWLWYFVELAGVETPQGVVSNGGEDGLSWNGERRCVHNSRILGAMIGYTMGDLDSKAAGIPKTRYPRCNPIFNPNIRTSYLVCVTYFSISEPEIAVLRFLSARAGCMSPLQVRGGLTILPIRHRTLRPST
ncbi:hypothetical protein MKZ38_009933 [Zalerion maritima]|uniref:Uncharacterized protein n=1 Tax=Zalerion maritima TaxID=339359 RepID=A0AAD5RUR1_9PEZI|nr:hypothetical protein MKZ38_009933 [Zalerion maritima]